MSKKIISIFLVAVMVLSALTTGVLADNTKITFTDVDASTQEGAAIYKLAENGIVNGNGDGTFTPNNSVTRAELCKMVNNIWKLTEPAEQGFSDVTEDKWYYKHVLIGKKAGYINGFDDGTFRGDTYVTREQACAIICRIAGLQDTENKVVVSDVVSDWALSYVNKILGNKLMVTEAGDKFRATENMKRGELAKVLSNFVAVTPETEEKPVEDDKDKDKDNNSGSSGGSGSSISGGSSGGSGSSGGGGGGGGSSTPNYKKQNETVVKQLDTAKKALTESRELFTDPEKEIVDLVIDVLKNLINDQSKYKINKENVYIEYGDKILDALDKYEKLGSSGRSAFASKISSLNPEVFNSLKKFFGIDFSDIEEEISK